MKTSPEDIDVGGERGEEGGQRAGGEVEPSDGGGEGREHVRREGDEDDEGAPAGEGDGEDERGDLGRAQFLLGVEEVIHAGGAPAHRDGEAPRGLRANNGAVMGKCGVAFSTLHAVFS